MIQVLDFGDWVIGNRAAGPLKMLVGETCRLERYSGPNVVTETQVQDSTQAIVRSGTPINLLRMDETYGSYGSMRSLWVGSFLTLSGPWNMGLIWSSQSNFDENIPSRQNNH